MQTIAERIKELIDKEKLTNKQFADKIEINPSIVSHILSGRNKVSLQVIENIKKAFTKVNLDYLLLGHGGLFEEFTNVNIRHLTTQGLEEPKEEMKDTSGEKEVPDSPSTTSFKSQTYPTENSLPYSTGNKAPIASEQGAEIEQIVVFFKDGTFQSYKSRS